MSLSLGPNISNTGLSGSSYDLSRVITTAQTTLTTELDSLNELANSIDENFVQACDLIINCQGRVIVTGMGKSGLIGRKIAATFASTGTPSFFMHPGEAGHGDLGMLVAGDVVIAISNSGESDEIRTLLPVIKKLNIPLISISKNSSGFLPKSADVALLLGNISEACPLGLAPTSSTTATLVLGDMLAVSLLDARGFTSEDFAFSHPAGALGKRLILKVADLMHSGDGLAKVDESASLEAALYEMTHKRLGMTAVVENEKIIGVFTDGDLRRALSKHQQLKELNIVDVMTQNPFTITQDILAVEALEVMRTKSINQLLVTDADNMLIGIITLHDLIQSGLVK